MKKTNAIKILILITLSSTTLTMMMLTLRFTISLYVFFIKGKFIFGIEDFIYSTKGGIAAGLPLGIGCWVLTKLEEKHKNK